MSLKFKRITVIFLGIIGFILVLEQLFLYLVSKGFIDNVILRKTAGNDVGIIGSADGPTSILLSNTQPSIIVLILSVLITIISIIYIIKTKSKS